ncbi:MAG: RNA polymerase sigma-70 factor [Jejuia sp.]
MKSTNATKLSYDLYKKTFNSLYPSLCLFATKYIDSLELAKDLVQDVFIKIWDKDMSFDNEEFLKSYLYTAVKNKALDTLKSKEYKKKAVFDIEALKLISTNSYFEKQVLIEETSRLVHEAVNTLPYKCKRIISLSLKGLENKQISEELAISLNTVKTQKRIAYQKLRPLLKGVYKMLF